MAFKFPLVLLATLLIAQPVFADDEMSNDEKTCAPIIKACLDAGYVEHGSNNGKQFWKDCMKPLILGKTVSDMNIDADTVKACRTAKIEKLQQELNELKAAN